MEITINPKFNVGDWVYFINNNSIRYAKIIEVEVELSIYEDKNTTYMEYALEGGFASTETYMYKTLPEALIAAFGWSYEKMMQELGLSNNDKQFGI